MQAARPGVAFVPCLGRVRGSKKERRVPRCCDGGDRMHAQGRVPRTSGGGPFSLLCCQPHAFPASLTTLRPGPPTRPRMSTSALRGQPLDTHMARPPGPPRTLSRAAQCLPRRLGLQRGATPSDKATPRPRRLINPSPSPLRPTCGSAQHATAGACTSGASREPSARLCVDHVRWSSRVCERNAWSLRTRSHSHVKHVQALAGMVQTVIYRWMLCNVVTVQERILYTSPSRRGRSES